jgi:hypothetical protein
MRKIIRKHIKNILLITIFIFLFLYFCLVFYLYISKNLFLVIILSLVINYFLTRLLYIWIKKKFNLSNYNKIKLLLIFITFVWLIYFLFKTLFLSVWYYWDSKIYSNDLYLIRNNWEKIFMYLEKKNYKNFEKAIFWSNFQDGLQNNKKEKEILFYYKENLTNNFNFYLDYYTEVFWNFRKKWDIYYILKGTQIIILTKENQVIFDTRWEYYNHFTSPKIKQPFACNYFDCIENPLDNLFPFYYFSKYYIKL